jgi:ABC-type microcin C transport system permease subunit YejE
MRKRMKNVNWMKAVRLMGVTKKEFERIMKKVLPESMISYERGEEL